MTIQMKAVEQYFPVALFIMLYKVVLTFETVDEILKCNHSNESYSAALSCCAACLLYCTTATLGTETDRCREDVVMGR